MYYIALSLTITIMACVIAMQNDKIMKLQDSIDTIYNEMKEECKLIDEIYKESKELAIENKDFLLSMQNKLEVSNELPVEEKQ